MMDDLFTLELAYSQVAWLMVILRLAPLLGMHTSSEAEQQTTELLESGRETLLTDERVAFRGDGSLQIAPEISRPLMACAYASHAVMCASRQPQSSAPLLTTTYFSPHLAVRHQYNAPTQMHTFTSARLRETMINRCVRDVSILPFAPMPIAAYTLPADLLKAASENNPAAIQAGVQSASIPDHQQTALTRLLTDYESQHTLALLGLQPSAGERKILRSITLTLYLQGGHGLCIDIQDPITARLRPYSSTLLTQEIAAWLSTNE